MKYAFSRLHAPRQRQAGMSLIELMIVVGIIGLLAGISMPQYTKFKRRAMRAEAQTNLHSLASLITSYHAEFGVVTDPANAGSAALSGGYYPMASDDVSSTSSCNSNNLYGFTVADCRSLRYSYWYGATIVGWKIIANDNGRVCPEVLPYKWWNDEVEYCPATGGVRLIHDVIGRGCKGPQVAAREVPTCSVLE